MEELGPLSNESSIGDTAFTMLAVEELINVPVGMFHTVWNSAESILALPSSMFADKGMQTSSPSVSKERKLSKISSKRKGNDWSLTQGWSLLRGCCVVSSEEQEKEGIVDVESVNTMIKVHEDKEAADNQADEAASPSRHAANFSYPWL
jgi:delta 1-pyrroline-5-carboxylate dehydrogenase